MTFFKEDSVLLNDDDNKPQIKNNSLRELNHAISKLNRKLSESDISFGNLLAQAPVAMMLIKGSAFTTTMINDAMLELIGKDNSIVRKNLFEELPEFNGQPSANMLIETFHMGKAHSEHSNPVRLLRNGQLELRYFNFNYTLYVEDGVVAGVIDMAVRLLRRF